MITINKRLWAWHFNFLQTLLGTIFALLIKDDIIFGVIAFTFAQAIFTKFAFYKSGAQNSKSIFKFFILGEIAKIAIFALISLIINKFYNINYLYLIFGLIWMQVSTLFLPIFIK